MTGLKDKAVMHIHGDQAGKISKAEPYHLDTQSEHSRVPQLQTCSSHTCMCDGKNAPTDSMGRYKPRQSQTVVFRILSVSQRDRLLSVAPNAGYL